MFDCTGSMEARHLHDIGINGLVCDLRRQIHPSLQRYSPTSHTKYSGWLQFVQTIALGPIACFGSPISFSSLLVRYFALFGLAQFQLCFCFYRLRSALITVHIFSVQSLIRCECIICDHRHRIFLFLLGAYSPFDTCEPMCQNITAHNMSLSLQIRHAFKVFFAYQHKNAAISPSPSEMSSNGWNAITNIFRGFLIENAKRMHNLDISNCLTKWFIPRDGKFGSSFAKVAYWNAEWASSITSFEAFEFCTKIWNENRLNSFSGRKSNRWHEINWWI